MLHKIYKKVVLIILDGFGVAGASRGNAISLAKRESLNYMVSNFPSLSLQASGPLVGLPWGEMGNSEVGHLNIGAGRIVGQDLPRITNAISSGEFFKNQTFLDAIFHTKSNHSALHLIGMVSTGGVHSLDEHIYALLGMAKEHELTNVFVHMFTDGRDTEPKAALESVKKLESKMQSFGLGKIATITGRFYAMDRGGHFAQTDLTYKALVEGQGETAASAEDCIKNNYNSQVFDEMIKPTVIVSQDKKSTAKISNNDSVIFVNFRQDRALQLTQAFVSQLALPAELRHEPLQNLYFATMTEYSKNLPVHAAFAPMDLKNNLAEVLSKSGKTQFHIAESEKYAHVTVFFNCGGAEKLPGEDWVIVQSPNNTRNYSDHPEMSALELTNVLAQKIAATETNFFLANYANTDMVGHTGNLTSATAAVAFIDKCLKKIMDSVLLADAVLIITGDHGNVEQMINLKTGDIDKDHTTNPVPFLLIANEFKFKKPLPASYITLASRVPEGIVSDIAPTILELMGLPKPAEMTGINLLDVIGK